jgi:AAA15 family ATPase/GTPase
MSEHFIKNIEIKNYKCFNDFKAEGFGRVNLIGGKNNVGKTAFMEAVYVNVQAQDIKEMVGSLSTIKYMRERLNFVDGKEIYRKINNTKVYIEQSNNIYTKSNINLASFKIEDNLGIKIYIFKFNNKIIKVNSNNFSYEFKRIDNIRFLDNIGLSNSYLITLYSAIQKRKEEQILNEILHKFDSRIESFKIIDNKPQCEINNKYYEITEFGDGVRHLISIVVALFTCEKGYLFIDEVDNGIHYTKLDEIWKIILKVSERFNVQVFATTHSKECIESYARVAKRLEDEEITFIELCKRVDEIKAFIYPFDWFIDEIEQEHEVRGCL